MTPDVDRRTAVSSSHLTSRWRERDSNPRSPLKRTTLFEGPPPNYILDPSRAACLGMLFMPPEARVCRQELPRMTFELVVNMNSSLDCKPFAALLAPTAHPLVAESRIG